MNGAMTMDDLRDAFGEIQRFMGRHEEKLENIRAQIEKQNGRVSKLEDAHAAMKDKVAEARGAWKAISAASALIGGGVAWAAKHFLPLLFVVAAHSQIAPDQLRQSPDAPTQLWAGTASGFVPVRLGQGVSIQKDASGFILQASTTAITTVRAVVVTLAPTNGTYQTSAALIFRNGVLQIEGVNFTRGAGGITPSTPWAATDNVVGVSFQPG